MKVDAVAECCARLARHPRMVLPVTQLFGEQVYMHQFKINGKAAFDGMAAPGAKIWATDCPLAAVQFQQHAGVKPMHPMSVLARAYREDGFKDEDEKS